MAAVTVNYRKASAPLLTSKLLPGNTTELLDLVRVMEAYPLSEFATSARSHYRSLGLFPQLTAVQTRIIVPRSGTIVGSWCRVDAVASDPSGIRSVRFTVTNISTGRSLALGPGTPSFYGWVTTWKTMGLPEGRYALTSTAVGSAGNSARSAPIVVDVRH